MSDVSGTLPGARIVSLSPGTILAAGPARTVEIAAATGYNAVGVRIDESMLDAEVLQVQRALGDHKIPVLDVEVIRLGVTPTAHQHRVIDIAAELGARSVVITSHLDDPAETTRQLAALVERASTSRNGLFAAFEFMAFTSVHTIHDALPIVHSAGAALIVDVLHVTRNGHSPETIETALLEDPPSLFLQMSDVARTDVMPDDLVYEARHERQIPGTGQIPLRDFLDVMPSDTPMSVEVQNDELFAQLGPEEFARRCRVAVAELLT